MGEELFRKSALDKLASPERLDVLMEVTSPKGWIALFTIASLLAGLIVWSIFGSIPERVDGQGVLITGGGLRQVLANGTGTLVKFTANREDVVKEGQVIGQISQIGDTEEVKAAQQRVDLAQREYQNAKAENDATISGIRSNIAGFEAEKSRNQLQLERAQEEATRLEDSLAKGLITKTRVDNARREVSSLQATLTGLDSQITNQRAQIRNVEAQTRAKLDALERAKLEFARLSVTKGEVSELKSTVSGRIVELTKRVGDRVTNGEVVVTVEPESSSGIEPYVYIDSANGKRIQQAMEAQIAPTTVRREEYGFMKGRIRTVGDFPVTAAAVKAIVGNDEQVRELLGSTTKLEVRIDLQPDAKTPSGYTWSSSSGPPFKIESGTRVTVSVVVARQAPISYVIPLPMLKQAFGG